MAIRSCPIHAHAGTEPSAVALVGEMDQFTYADLDSQIVTVVEHLMQSGLRPGDRLALALPNSWAHVVLLWACFRCRLVALPLSTRFPTAQVVQLVKHLGCKMLITEENLEVYTSELPDLRVLAVASFMEKGLASQTTTPVSVDMQKPATLLLSSGSTGLPKAILHRWGNHYLSALGANENIAMEQGDRSLLSLPLYHVAGVAILFRAFIAGATVVLPQSNASLAEQLSAQQITHVSLVGTQLKRLLEDGGGPIDTLKAILLGGSAISRGLISKAYDAGLPIHTSYGMTEMASQITTTPPGASLETLCTSGQLLNYRRLKFDDNGQVLVKGAPRFLGYVEGEDLKKPFDEFAWYATGDIGRLDAAGNLIIEGRIDNMFISGGENIHPEEIERALQTHAAIVRAFVVPVPDTEFGFRPVAFLDTVGDMPTAEALDVYLAPHIARFMNPVAYFPLSNQATGEMKVSRKKLAELAAVLRASGS